MQPAGLSFAVEAAETILQAALRQGIDFPYRCRQGVCTACVCRLKSGSVHYLAPDPLSEVDKLQQFTYCCEERVDPWTVNFVQSGAASPRKELRSLAF
jgi:ferredoxin